MKFGVYEQDITPPLGLNIPGYFVSRLATGILDNLFVRVMVFIDDEDNAFILVNMDTISTDSETTAKARAKIEKMTGVPAYHVMIAATHSHTAGPVDNFVPNTIDQPYMDWLIARIADTAYLAFNHRQTVKIGIGSTLEDSIAFIRRYRMKDGSFKTNPGFIPDQILEPAGTIDPEVTVVKIEDLDGKLLGVITNYACHLDTVGGNKYSADYPGELSRILKRVYGSNLVSVFLTGACGNINHVDYLNKTSEYYNAANPRHHIRMGRILAGSVIRALATILTEEGGQVGVTNTEVTARVRIPEQSEIEKAETLLKARPYEVVISTGNKGSAGDADLIERHFARSLLEVNAIKDKQVTIPIQVARVAGLGVVAMPCELFVEFGLDIKANSPFERTMISTLTNDNFGYISVKEAFGQGGYETTISGSTMLDAQTGYDMVDAAKRSLDVLK